jgi:hypothetical protein
MSRTGRHGSPAASTLACAVLPTLHGRSRPGSSRAAPDPRPAAQPDAYRPVHLRRAIVLLTAGQGDRPPPGAADVPIREQASTDRPNLGRHAPRAVA